MFTPFVRRSPLVVALALGLASLGHSAMASTAAATAAPAVVKPAAAASTTAPAAVKKTAAHRPGDRALSHHGFQTMRDIGQARMALAHGDTQAASALLQRAIRSLDLVEQVAARHTADVKTELLSIDGRIALADSFVDTPRKHTHIAKANEHLTQGRANEARDELRLAEIDASMTQVLMPLDATRRHLNAATVLVAAQQYHDANLALKAAEEGLVLKTVAIREIPVPNASRQ